MIFFLIIDHQHTIYLLFMVSMILSILWSVPFLSSFFIKIYPILIVNGPQDDNGEQMGNLLMYLNFIIFDNGKNTYLIKTTSTQSTLANFSITSYCINNYYTWKIIDWWSTIDWAVIEQSPQSFILMLEFQPKWRDCGTSERLTKQVSPNILKLLW